MGTIGRESLSLVASLDAADLALQRLRPPRLAWHVSRATSAAHP